MTLRKVRGFTLVEVMVALAIMGIVTAMAWQGIDAVLKAQKYNRARSSEIAVMQTLLAQWDNDLNHIELNSSGNIAPDIPPIQYEKESALLRREGLPTRSQAGMAEAEARRRSGLQGQPAGLPDRVASAKS